MLFKEPLNENTFLLFATKEYENPHCEGVEEFNVDMRRFTSLKRLLLRVVRDKDDSKERLILNHIIVINNLFGNIAAARLLFFFIDQKCHVLLATYLYFLSALPDDIPEAKNEEAINIKLLERLENI